MNKAATLDIWGRVRFGAAHAIAAGRVTRQQLRRAHVRLFRDVYIPRGVAITARVRALAAACFCTDGYVLVGASAAAMYRTKWLDSCAPAEVVRPHHHTAPPGMVARQWALADDEVTTVAGVRVTTPARTAFDIGRTVPRRKAIVIIDALCRATGLDPEDIARLADRHPGARGMAELRAILPDVDGGADSPPETDLRLALIDAGLPRPETQVKVRDLGGGFIASCDLGWTKWKVIVEYDGDGHWGTEQRADDIERLVLIERYGWTVIRATSRLLYREPHVLIQRVRETLRAAGAPVQRVGYDANGVRIAT